MCVMHAPINRKTINVWNKSKTKKVVKPFNEELLKPDPDFIDERKQTYKEPEKKGFFAKLLQ